LRAEPAADSVLNRAPRNLRLFYDGLPDVPNSGLTLTGPDGNYDLRGFHTMGSDDLMIEITNPSIPDGEYVVAWSAVIGEDSTAHEGSYRFYVATDR
jgi:methionine-rich copper-binding protein CopC